MGTLRQYYGEGGVPLRVEHDPDVPARAWLSQRRRLRAWLAGLQSEDWSGPTRCSLWDATALVRHLASGSQFLGYTLHKANAAVATALMQGFDTHLTVQDDAPRFGELTPDAAQRLLATKDASVEAELRQAANLGWSTLAEAPPGNVPAHLAVNHFLLDSWVHEYDLMLPRDERPIIDRVETEAVVGYLIGLASIQTGTTTPIDLRLTDPDLRVGVDLVNETVLATVGSAPSHAAVIEGAAVDVVDRATGRQSGPLKGDPAALAVLDSFGALLAG